MIGRREVIALARWRGDGVANRGARGTAEENLSRGAARHRRPDGRDRQASADRCLRSGRARLRRRPEHPFSCSDRPTRTPEQLDDLAAELKGANVDVIVTFGYPAALAAKKSTRDIPIVISAAGDPVATGLVDGVARPGGNITGVTELSTELSAKRLEILKDAVPALARVAMLWNAADLGMTLRYRAAEDAASLLGNRSPDLGRARARRFRACLRRDDARAARRHPDGVRRADHAQPQARRGICQHQPAADDLRD